MGTDTWRRLALAILASMSMACGIGGTFRAGSRGAEIARDAMSCPKLDSVFAVPHRYMTSEDNLYKGCGQYALVRCTISVSAPPDQEVACELVETVTEKVALQD